MTSVDTMVKHCEGLIGTKDITEWETDFMESVVEKSQGGRHTERLTGRQIEALERIYKKHFAGMD